MPRRWGAGAGLRCGRRTWFKLSLGSALLRFEKQMFEGKISQDAYSISCQAKRQAEQADTQALSVQLDVAAADSKKARKAYDEAIAKANKSIAAVC